MAGRSRALDRPTCRGISLCLPMAVSSDAALCVVFSSEALPKTVEMPRSLILGW